MSDLPIIIIGKTGQLARKLVQYCEWNRAGAVAYGRSDCDLASDTDTINAFLKTLPAASGLILAAAYTAVDAAETDTETAFAVNTRATGLIADYCAARDLPMVYVSTDYVFSGEKTTPYTPDDPVDPINQYGASKLAGENAILESGARAAILRTSWVYDGIGKNFFTTMLRLGKAREELSVVGDQIGRPTFSGHLASACLTALGDLGDDVENSTGIFHFSNSGDPVSWAEFAKAIFSIATGYNTTVTPIPTTDYPTPTKRPKYSVMNTDKYENVFTAHPPDWRLGLKAAYAEWKDAKTKSQA